MRVIPKLTILLISVLGITITTSSLLFSLPWENETSNFPSNNIDIELAFPDLQFSKPIEIISDHHGQKYVLEQAGIVYHFNSSDSSSLKTVLDIRDQVKYGGEMGLLGIALNPDFQENGYFFLYYTVDNPLRSIISRFTFNFESQTTNITSEFKILEVKQPFFNHNGGKINFGPDGYLYIALGDGGSSGDPMNNGQNKSTLLGSILRINVDIQTEENNYSIPADNPFVNNTQGFKKEIYAFGLRNPWQFSFDSLNGDLWTGDVGQNEWEEINIIQKGKNYGWRIKEGYHCYSPSTGCNSTGLTDPVFEYGHGIGYSITGGFVYRGKIFPDLYGYYIYADYGTGIIWALNSSSRVENYILIDTNLKIVSFAEDENNELFISAFDGKIYQFKNEKISSIGSNTSSDIIRNSTISTSTDLTTLEQITPSFQIMVTIIALGSVTILSLNKRKRD
ncbi:MAG: PQQ-dependent sugar dehydrogenase [Candidatus Hodarchaeales archaeon]|jgi:glucose/arabinose dehydrogenase